MLYMYIVSTVGGSFK